MVANVQCCTLYTVTVWSEAVTVYSVRSWHNGGGGAVARALAGGPGKNLINTSNLLGRNSNQGHAAYRASVMATR